MRRHHSGRTRHRSWLGVALVVVCTAGVCLASPTVLAGTGPGSDDGGELAAAEQALAQARLQALQAHNQVAEANQQLAAAQAALAQAQAQLAALDARITTLTGQIASDQARISQLEGQIGQEKQALAAFLRESYESGGSQTTVEYLVDSQNIGDLLQRITAAEHVASSGDQLVGQIEAEESQEQQVMEAAVTARQLAQAAQQQAATQEAIVANDEASDTELLAADQLVANQAQAKENAAQSQYDQIEAYERAYADAAAALAQARADGTIFLPVAGPTFTEDTDLTLPSGENVQTIDGFLAGTALAGLGSSYIQAEQTYGVSALYLVAHSIEESAWGTSAIAQGKNNLFGYGADDSNPYVDAASFPSFAACILYVAQQVKQNYLTPGGAFYHGPTLRGMNVDYASDPYWASKIASIADTIPLPHA